MALRLASLSSLDEENVSSSISSRKRVGTSAAKPRKGLAARKGRDANTMPSDRGSSIKKKMLGGGGSGRRALGEISNRKVVRIDVAAKGSAKAPRYPPASTTKTPKTAGKNRVKAFSIFSETTRPSSTPKTPKTAGKSRFKEQEIKGAAPAPAPAPASTAKVIIPSASQPATGPVEDIEYTHRGRGLYFRDDAPEAELDDFDVAEIMAPLRPKRSISSTARSADALVFWGEEGAMVMADKAMAGPTCAPGMDQMDQPHAAEDTLDASTELSDDGFGGFSDYL